MRNRPLFLGLLSISVIIIVTVVIILIIHFTNKKSSEKSEEKKDEPVPIPTPEWETYDCYVFAIFWSESSCYTKKYDKDICYQTIKEIEAEDHFIIHGLWPSFYEKGKQIEKCNKGEDIPINIKEGELLTEMKRFIPGLYSNNSKLWANEYNKHGYCYIQRIGMDPLKDYPTYFEKTISLYNLFDFRNFMTKMLPDTKNGTYNISKEKFIKLLGSKPYNIREDQICMKCDKNSKLLTEMRFYLDLNFSLIQNPATSNCPDVFKMTFLDEQKQAVYEKYDFYVFALIWNPTDCKTIGKECYKKLYNRTMNVFHIHGLWPSYKSGVIPQQCNLDSDVPIIDDESELFKQLDMKWPGVYTNSYNFWTFEYNKHGYCYIQRLEKDPKLEYKEFFQKCLDLYDSDEYKFANISEIFTKDLYPDEHTYKKSEITEKLDKIYGKNKYKLDCKEINGKDYLSGIYFHFDLNFSLIDDGKSGLRECKDEFILEIIEHEKPHKHDDKIADDYDSYVYSILWQASECKARGSECYRYVKKADYNTWSIHGLWPGYKSGKIGDWCNGPNDIEVDIQNSTLLEYMNKHWFSAYHTNPFFWGHEYNKHGYCYNKRFKIDINNYEPYFKKTIEIYESYGFKDMFSIILGEKKIIGDNLIQKSDLVNYLKNSLKLEKEMYTLYCYKYEDKIYIIEIMIILDENFVPYKRNSTLFSDFPALENCPDEFYAEFLE